MKLTFDARLAPHPGMGRYLTSLLDAMVPMASDIHFTLLGNPSELLRYKKYANVTVVPCAVPIYGWKEQREMPRYFEGAQLAHVPHFNTPWSMPCPYVVTIHDLIHFEIKEYVPFPGALLLLSAKLNRIAQSAKAVIAVSDATRQACVRRFPRMESKLTVVHEAAHAGYPEATSLSMDEARQKFHLPKRFFLYVGSLREHKNVHGLLDAFDRLCRRTEDVSLVLAGKLDERFDRKHRFSERIRSNPRILYAGPVSDTELAALYALAHYLILPSFYEGFGLPVVEAMRAGTPVIVSRIPSLTEVAGGAALEFDPHQIDRFEEVLYNALSDNDLRQKLAVLGKARAACFSWRSAAEQTLAIYRKCV